MLTLKEKMDVNLTHSNPAGTWHGTGQTKLRGSNGLTWERVFISINDLSDLTRVDFYKLPRDVTSAYVQEYVDNQGQYSNYQLDWTNRDNITTTNCLTPSSTTNSLLTLANQFKDIYFGGVTQTASTLFAYLEGMYGNANGFFYVRTGGGSLYATQRIGTVESCITEYGSAPNSVLTWNPSDVITWGNEYMLPSTVDSADAIAAALIFGPEISPEKLAFDVYVDGVIGEKGPNIQVKFRNTVSDSALSENMIAPHIWIWGEYQPNTKLHVVDGITVPFDANFKYNHTFEFTGKYMSDYVGQSNSITSNYNTAQKLMYFGLDGIADNLIFFLRFDYKQLNAQDELEAVWGDLFQVTIPFEYEGAAYIDVQQVSSSKYNAPFNTEVNVIGGVPPEDPEDDNPDSPDLVDPDGENSPIGPYDPDYGVPDLSNYESTGFDGNAILTNTYSMTGLIANNVGTKLWSQSYLDVMKIQNNPIENIISMKWYPMNLTGTSTEIKVGDVNFGVYGDKINTMYTKTIGSFKYTVDSSRPGYLSCSPYTSIKMHLPYCGTVQLDATEILNRTVTVKYIVDLVTGDCLALITLDQNVPYMEVSGKMGVDIPLTASNRMQTELAAASRALSASIGAAGHLMGGDVLGASNEATGIMSMMGMDYATQRTQTHSSACASYMNRAIYVEIRRPNWDNSNGYLSRHGRPYHKFTKLSKLSGFVQVDTRTTINVAMTAEENRMLEEIMTTGFYM